jgi:hypothetical protein
VQHDVGGGAGDGILARLLQGARPERAARHAPLARPAERQRARVVQQQRLDQPEAGERVREQHGRQPQPGDVGVRHRGLLRRRPPRPRPCSAWPRGGSRGRASLRNVLRNGPGPRRPAPGGVVAMAEGADPTGLASTGVRGRPGAVRGNLTRVLEPPDLRRRVGARTGRARGGRARRGRRGGGGSGAARPADRGGPGGAGGRLRRDAGRSGRPGGGRAAAGAGGSAAAAAALVWGRCGAVPPKGRPLQDAGGDRPARGVRGKRPCAGWASPPLPHGRAGRSRASGREQQGGRRAGPGGRRSAAPHVPRGRRTARFGPHSVPPYLAQRRAAPAAGAAHTRAHGAEEGAGGCQAAGAARRGRAEGGHGDGAAHDRPALQARQVWGPGDGFRETAASTGRPVGRRGVH